MNTKQKAHKVIQIVYVETNTHAFEMDNLIQAIQASNDLTLSRGVTRITEDHHGKKSLLAASNDSCWMTTSGPKILMVKMRNDVKWRCRVRKRVKANSIKRKDLKSAVHATKIEAEMSLHSFRFNAESKAGKESVLERVKQLIENEVSPPVVEAFIENNNESASDITSSLQNTSDSDSPKGTTSSTALVNFDVKGNIKKKTPNVTRKRKEMSMPREFTTDSSMCTRNPKSTGSFGTSTNCKM